MVSSFLPPQGASALQVLVAHAQPLLELGLASVLCGQPGIQVQGQPARFDIAITDQHRALQLLRQAREGCAPPALAHARVVVLAVQYRERDVREALEAGAWGYLLMDCGVPELVDGLRAIGRGHRHLCNKAAHGLADSMAREGLTARELDVLGLLAQGACNKRIAAELEIALGTVKAHMKAILAKLGAGSRTQALSIAMDRGLVRACR